MQIWNGSDEYCWRYRADTILSTDGETDIRTDGRTDGQGDTSIPPYQLRWSGGYNKLQRNVNGNSNIFIKKNAFENVCEMAAILSRLQCVNVTQFGSIQHWCNRVQRNRKSKTKTSLGIILWKCRANGRWHYNATSSLIGWAHTQNHPCSTMHERSQQHTRHTTCIQCMMYLDIKIPTKSSKDLRLQILF